MIKSITGFIAGRYLWLVIPLLTIALIEGNNVAQGLHQGSGLHGYFLDHGGGDGSEGTSIPVWNAFLKTVISASLAGISLLINFLRRLKTKPSLHESEKLLR